MVVNGRPVKRARPRRTAAGLCDFLTFPTAEDAAVDLDGPFRSNMRAFLVRHGRLRGPPPADAPHLQAWRVTFRVGGGTEEPGEEDAAPPAVVELDVVDEDVPRSKSIYCDQCRVVGWSGHPVCGKRYHFIIRNDKNALPGCHPRACVRCGSLLSPSDSRCISCQYEIKGYDVDNNVYKQLEDSTHLLHGVVHANGFGHLLRVNGLEGGSEFLTGFDIMGFWDRLCKMLRVRKVSVMDISKKYGMDYRLLNAVTAGHSWYGKWGYKFGAGSFALTAEAYQKAVETLSALPLSLFFLHSRCQRSTLQNIILLYWSISDRPLVTVRDLFCYVIQLLHDAHLPASKKLLDKSSTALCKWSLDEIRLGEEFLIKVLRAVGGLRWVTRRALKGAACHAVKADLIDYCLNGLSGRCADNGMQVAVRFNDKTKNVEYRLEPSNDLPSSNCLPKPSADQLLSDLKFLYNALLNPASMQPYKPTTVREAARSSAARLLDCKQFIKHYDEPPTNMLPYNPFVIGVWCHVELLDHPTDYTAPPAELLVLPMTATIADLKLEAAKAFQDTYLIFQRFQAEELTDMANISDATPVQQYFSSNGMAKIRGRCVIGDCKLGQFRKERGLETWVVECSCGAKDDDGERMMACDACGTWQHTRCAGIRDSDEVPARFICRKCAMTRKAKGRSGSLRFREAGPRGGMCKEDISSTLSTTGRLARMTTVG